MPISTRQIITSFLSALALAILIPPVGATLVPRVTLEEMASEAEFVVHGKVARKWSAWDSRGQTIWTHYELRIEEALKGASGSSLVVSEPGGIVGDEGMSIPGTPEYSPGDEVVLLVWRTPIGYLRTSGWGQGKFTVSTAKGSSSKTVHTSLQVRGIELVEAPKAAGPRRAETLPSALNGLSLDEFKGRLRLLMLGAGGAR